MRQILLLFFIINSVYSQIQKSHCTNVETSYTETGCCEDESLMVPMDTMTKLSPVFKEEIGTQSLETATTVFMTEYPPELKRKQKRRYINRGMSQAVYAYLDLSDRLKFFSEGAKNHFVQSYGGNYTVSGKYPRYTFAVPNVGIDYALELTTGMAFNAGWNPPVLSMGKFGVYVVQNPNEDDIMPDNSYGENVCKASMCWKVGSFDYDGSVPSVRVKLDAKKVNAGVQDTKNLVLAIIPETSKTLLSITGVSLLKVERPESCTVHSKSLYPFPGMEFNPLTLTDLGTETTLNKITEAMCPSLGKSPSSLLEKYVCVLSANDQYKYLLDRILARNGTDPNYGELLETVYKNIFSPFDAQLTSGFGLGGMKQPVKSWPWPEASQWTLESTVRDRNGNELMPWHTPHRGSAYFSKEDFDKLEDLMPLLQFGHWDFSTIWGLSFHGFTLHGGMKPFLKNTSVPNQGSCPNYEVGMENIETQKEGCNGFVYVDGWAYSPELVELSTIDVPVKVNFKFSGLYYQYPDIVKIYATSDTVEDPKKATWTEVYMGSENLLEHYENYWQPGNLIEQHDTITFIQPTVLPPNTKRIALYIDSRYTIQFSLRSFEWETCTYPTSGFSTTMLTAPTEDVLDANWKNVETNEYTGSTARRMGGGIMDPAKLGNFAPPTRPERTNNYTVPTGLCTKDYDLTYTGSIDPGFMYEVETCGRLINRFHMWASLYWDMHPYSVCEYSIKDINIRMAPGNVSMVVPSGYTEDDAIGALCGKTCTDYGNVVRHPTCLK